MQQPNKRRERPLIGLDMRFLPQGDMTNADKVGALIRSYCASHRDASKVLVCRDSECTPIEETKSACSTVEDALARRMPVPVSYIVVDHSIEGWLMSDPVAISRVLGTRVPPEKLRVDCRPAEKLNRLFRANGRSFAKSQHNRQLAEAADVETISHHSPTFREFQRALTGAD